MLVDGCADLADNDEVDMVMSESSRRFWRIDTLAMAARG